MVLTHSGYEHPIVWNEPNLDHSWEELEAEIDRREQLGRVTKIAWIEITNVEITSERIAALVDIFRSGRVTNSSDTIDFDNVNLYGEGIITLSKVVDVSSELQCFCLCHNRIDHMDLARYLSRH
jgi:hypothetical protein